jgi:hypothetical protein
LKSLLTLGDFIDSKDLVTGGENDITGNSYRRQ